jgi:ABC-type Fe3+-hydroxamate transport system substrate-binding protein
MADRVPRGVRLALVSAVLLIALASCGDDDSSSATATTASGTPTTADAAGTSTTAPTAGDACRLVTEEEAADLLGGPVTADARSAGGVDSCSYARDPATEGILAVTVTSQLDYYEAQKANLPDPTDVTGLGDEAVWDDTLDQLLVRAGDQAFGVTWGGNGITADQASAVALAQAIISRL